MDYFSGIFASAWVLRLDNVTSSLQCCLSTDACDRLDKPFVVDVIVTALKQMCPYKAPGPNGLNAHFYQKYWNIIDHDISNMILYFLNNRFVFSDYNYTNIVMVTKK